MEHKEYECDCDNWQEYFPQILSAQILANMHGAPYTGKRFKYCPWCAKELKEKAA